MADFFEADFAGSGTLNGYTPEIGTLTAPTPIDLDDGTTIQTDTAASVLTALVRDGAGNVNYNWNENEAYYSILKFTDAPVGDYYFEQRWRLDPSVTVFDILLGVRASPMIVGGWADAVNFFGGLFRFSGDGTIQAGTMNASNGSTGNDLNYTSSDYGSGMRDFVLRFEVSGSDYVVKVDGVIVDSGTIVDPDGNFTGAERANYTALSYSQNLTLDWSDDGGGPGTGSTYLPQWQGAKLGTFAPGVFWKDYVMTHEIDS